MDYPLSPEEIRKAMSMGEVVAEVMDIEPGNHPDIPEKIHTVLRSLLATVLYTIGLSEETELDFTQHKLDQRIQEKAIFKVLMQLGVSPDIYQKTIIQVTEELGGKEVGKA